MSFIIKMMVCNWSSHLNFKPISTYYAVSWKYISSCHLVITENSTKDNSLLQRFSTRVNTVLCTRTIWKADQLEHNGNQRSVLLLKKRNMCCVYTRKSFRFKGTHLNSKMNVRKYAWLLSLIWPKHDEINRSTKFNQNNKK